MIDDPFVTHRGLLFTVAYEMLGSAVDAEDVVQETWLRWADVDHAEVRDPRSYLVRIVTRLALKERYYSAVMSATGLLYLAILTAFGTDLVARAILSR